MEMRWREREREVVETKHALSGGWQADVDCRSDGWNELLPVSNGARLSVCVDR